MKSGAGSRKEQWKASLHAADRKAPAPAQSSSSPPPLPNNNVIWFYTSLDDARQREGFGPVEKVPQTLLLAETSLTDFMMDLCDKFEDLVKDDNLTMEEFDKT
ncbi:hypothetical protein THAOC_27537 [Thalassiosira oceanica]|uniref:Uncharacterized protein n=1 Tax=Thalassiosira oceanica TaxID=159749 RepID=K0RIN0_THAOC|nr:hypothetical protein THAOC_27537 [Thalassiosira oceanica]|eukprot:EJK53090.1 hypothetical protein THAOC_27537 [Thalassiosira oceanica]